MAYPVQLRDELYKLFESRDLDEMARLATRRNLLTDKMYILDRLPRYRRALAAASGAPGDPLRDAVLLGQSLFNEGLFFECHECLEGRWRAAEGKEKRLLKGLIQLGAALHKLELDPQGFSGPLEGLENSLVHLGATIQLVGAGPESLAPILEVVARLRRGALDLSDVPRLRLV